MPRAHLAFVALILVAALTLSIPAVPRAQAADVNLDLHAQNFLWHVGTVDSTSTTITVTAGDTIRLTIIDHDNADHTFTAPQFGVDEDLPPLTTIFVNFTTDAGDVGTWQFYCEPHSTGTYPNRQGMIGTIVVQAAATAPPPADNTLLYAGVGIVLVVVVIAAVALGMRKKKSGGPGTGGAQP